jgi:hypothetical protein
MLPRSHRVTQSDRRVGTVRIRVFGLVGVVLGRAVAGHDVERVSRADLVPVGRLGTMVLRGSGEWETPRQLPSRMVADCVGLPLL